MIDIDYAKYCAVCGDDISDVPDQYTVVVTVYGEETDICPHHTDDDIADAGY